MIWIGIDPGRHTGFAVWDGTGFRDISTLPLHEALRRTHHILNTEPDEVMVVFEDARKRKWIPREKSVSDYRGKLMGAGSVKKDCVIIEDFCKDYGIPFEALAPRPRMTKWDDKVFARMTGYTGRTSEHGRDAALLVWGRRWMTKGALE